MKKLALAKVIYTFVAINKVANLLCASGRLMNTANWLHRSPTGRSTWVVWCGAGCRERCRLATMACSAGLLGLDTGNDEAKRISHALRLFGRLHQSFLQRLGGGRQTTWVSFFNLCHVAVSVTVI